jgi:hypothetical protein
MLSHGGATLADLTVSLFSIRALYYRDLSIQAVVLTIFITFVSVNAYVLTHAARTSTLIVHDRPFDPLFTAVDHVVWSLVDCTLFHNESSFFTLTLLHKLARELSTCRCRSFPWCLLMTNLEFRAGLADRRLHLRPLGFPSFSTPP